jgi:hypothetical protein
MDRARSWRARSSVHVQTNRRGSDEGPGAVNAAVVLVGELDDEEEVCGRAVIGGNARDELGLAP